MLKAPNQERGGNIARRMSRQHGSGTKWCRRKGQRQSKKKVKDRVIKAIKVQSTIEEGGEALDLTSLHANKEWKMGTVATKYNMDNAGVLLSEENQHVAAEIEVRQGAYEHDRLKAWADRVREASIMALVSRARRGDKPETGTKGR